MSASYMVPACMRSRAAAMVGATRVSALVMLRRLSSMLSVMRRSVGESP
jgi:hypothetical protein